MARLREAAGWRRSKAPRPGRRDERRPAAASRGRRATIRQGALDKGEDAAIVDQAIELDAERRRLTNEADGRKAERNRLSQEVGTAIRGGARPDDPTLAETRRRANALGAEIAALDTQIATAEHDLEELLLRIPNPADADVPIGGEDASVIVRTWGEPAPHVRVDGSIVQPHWEVGEAQGILDLAGGRQGDRHGLPHLPGRGGGAPAGVDRLHGRTARDASTASPRSGRRPWSTRRRLGARARSPTRKT